MNQFWGRKVAFRTYVLGLWALVSAGSPGIAQVAIPSCTAIGGSFCSQPVGQMSGEQNVTVTARAAGTVASVQVLTMGVTGRDFEPVNGQLTCDQVALNPSGNASCQESITFSPAFPGPRTGAVVLFDSAGNVLGMAPLSGTGIGGLGVLVTGNILPVAGDGSSGVPVLDGAAATSASLNNPTGIAVDGAGNQFIADRGHNLIRKVTAATGIISTLAGNGNPAYTGDGLASTDPGVSLDVPSSVALDSLGNVYIADTANNVIRKITAATGIISTVAGTGQPGSSGDLGPATAATLNQPQGVTVDATGNLYIADTANHRIRRVDVTGTITTIAGTGVPGYQGDSGPASAAELNLPRAVAFDPAGNMFIPDSANNVIREVVAVNGVITAAGTISTFAGTGVAGYTGDGAAALHATLVTPSGVVADAAGNLYIADTGNASIRKVSSATGLISTIARNNTGVYIYNDRGPYTVSIWGPTALFLDGAANLYFADALNNRIREIQSNQGFLNFTGTLVAQGAQSSPQYQAIENDGNAALRLTSISTGNNTVFAVAEPACTAMAPESSNAVVASSLPVNGTCAIGAIFAPMEAGAPLFGNVDVIGDMPNSPLETQIIGGTSNQNSTTTTVTSNVNPSGFGQAVTFTATVVSAGTAAATGTVTFFDGSAVLTAPITLNAAGQAAFTTSALAVGLHAITASYSGDSASLAGVSAVLTQTVLEATSTALVSSINPSAVGQSVAFTATVTALAGGVTPDGTVTFTDGEFTLATVPVSVGGVAVYSTAALTNGSHAVVANYIGDAAHQVLASVSNLVRQAVLVDSQCAVTSAPNPSAYGSAVVFTVAVASSGNNPPTGTVALLDSGAPIGTASLVGSAGSGAFITSSLSVGSHIITAAYPGDLNNASSTSTALVQVVNKSLNPTATTTTLSAFPEPGVAGGPVALTAAVETTRSGATLTGTVVFTDTFNGTTVALGSAPLAASGLATLNAVFAPGTHSITAAYGGDNADAASASAPLTLPVQMATSATALTSSADPSAAGAGVLFTATLASNGGIPTGTVTFTADNVSLGSAPLNARGVATLSSATLPPGTHAVIASYPGDANNGPSSSLPISQVVELIPTTTALTPLPTPAFTGAAAVTLQAAVTGNAGPLPSGTVTFTVGTTTLGSSTLDATGVATLTPTLAAGTYTVVAAYGGDALHAPSTSQAVSVEQALSTFTLSAAPSTVDLETNQSATTTVTLASTGGFTDTIALACSGLPTGVTCHFSSTSVPLAANGVSTAQLTFTAGSTVSSNSTAGVALGGLFLPFGLLTGCLLAPAGRRRKSLHLFALLALGCASLLTTGCTTIHLNAKNTQAYTFQVTGTGAATNATQSATVTLNASE
jgi:sugar lactone lactonase YvrE